MAHAGIPLPLIVVTIHVVAHACSTAIHLKNRTSTGYMVEREARLAYVLCANMEAQYLQALLQMLTFSNAAIALLEAVGIAQQPKSGDQQFENSITASSLPGSDWHLIRYLG